MVTRFRLTRDGTIDSGTGVQKVFRAGIYGPAGDLPFSEDDAKALAERYKFPSDCDMYRQMVIWHETMRRVDQEVGTPPPGAQIEQLDALEAAAKRMLDALRDTDESTDRLVANRASNEVIAIMQAEDLDEACCYSKEALAYQLELLVRSAKHCRTDVQAYAKHAGKAQPQKHPGFAYVLEHLIAKTWRDHQATKFDPKFSETDYKATNPCSQFVLEVSEKLRPENPPEANYIRSLMKRIQKNYNARKPEAKTS